MTFWEHFRELAGRGVTLLFSTHQMDEAMFCNRLAILHEGTLLADDTPHQLLWKSHAKIKIWQGKDVESFKTTNYPQRLPEILREYGLDPGIIRIEIEEEILETIILSMIQVHENLHPTEQGDDPDV